MTTAWAQRPRVRLARRRAAQLDQLRHRAVVQRRRVRRPWPDVRRSRVPSKPSTPAQGDRTGSTARRGRGKRPWTQPSSRESRGPRRDRPRAGESPLAEANASRAPDGTALNTRTSEPSARTTTSTWSSRSKIDEHGQRVGPRGSGAERIVLPAQPPRPLRPRLHVDDRHSFGASAVETIATAVAGEYEGRRPSDAEPLSR